MKRSYGFTFSLTLFCLISILFLASGCKSEFERLRASGETEKMYAAANEYYEEGEFLKAQTLYELVLNNYRGKSETEELYFNYAYTHYYLYEYILASYYFQRYANTFATSPKREEALYMAAYCNYKMAPSYRLDQEYTQTAIDGFQTFVNTYPDSERAPQCNEYIDELRQRLEEKAVKASQLYYDMKDYNSAVLSFQQVLQDFPDTKAEEDIREKVVKSQYQLAINSVYEKKEDRAKEVITYYEQFVKKYPESSKLKELNKIKENTLDLIKELQNERHKITSTRS